MTESPKDNADHSIPDAEHPDYVDGVIDDEELSADSGLVDEDDPFDEDDLIDDTAALTPNPGGPTGVPQLPPKNKLPVVPGIPGRLPLPLRYCGPLSGRYRNISLGAPFPIQTPTATAETPAVPSPTSPFPLTPINTKSVTVRVDADRYFPQRRISIEVRRLFGGNAHAIARITSDRCISFNNRRIVARIYYRDGVSALIPGTTVIFTASRAGQPGFGYNSFKLTLSGGGINPITYKLRFESPYFDDVEFEVDATADAGTPITTYNTGAHPNRPATLPAETLSLATVYRRAGFNAKMSPNANVVPVSGAGPNNRWSDNEIHDAMITYWSRFANNPNWAMWVLYARQHDLGHTLGGKMFDDIGGNHRQGTAIFTDSFINDAPSGDPNPTAWRNRMHFWTAVHEMGHAFNLAHSWQKALSLPTGESPWIPLANAPEARSFMNYPYGVSGGQSAFFSDFRFRFSNDELTFMRHAPRRFVQMGNSDWFENHGFEAPSQALSSGRYALELRPNREGNWYQFLEPVVMELKLTNTGSTPLTVDGDMLADGSHVNIFIQREGAATAKKWRPMVTSCHQPHADRLDPQKSIYGAHMVGVSTQGWLIDEPGFYKLQAVVDMGDEIVTSNVLRLYVAPPQNEAESAIAPDYFTENVGRALVFAATPGLGSANDVLADVVERAPTRRAAIHARVAMTASGLAPFKTLQVGASGRDDLKIVSRKPNVAASAGVQIDALTKAPETAADTLGNIQYFKKLRTVAKAMEVDGDDKGALNLMTKCVKLMKERHVLERVINEAEAQIRSQDAKV